MSDSNSAFQIQEKDKNSFFSLLRDYIKSLQKEEIVARIPHDQLDATRLAVLFASLASTAEIAELKTSNTRFNEIIDILKNINDSTTETVNLIYRERLNNAEIWLQETHSRFIKDAVGNNYANFINLKNSADKTKIEASERILSNALKSKDKTFTDTFSAINRAHHNFSSSLLFKEISHDVVKTLQNDELIEYAAFLIFEPKHQFPFFLDTDPGWKDFPLKWLASNNPLSLIKDLLYYHNKNEDLGQYFIQKYEDHAFEDLQNLCRSTYLNGTISNIMTNRASLIEEVIGCYKNDNYAATICLALSLIEGIIWDFAIHWHTREEAIFDDEQYSVLKNQTSKNPPQLTIGLLIKNSILSEIFDTQFIKYFSEELYTERNPVLHGRDLSKFTQVNAAKKIATLEYVLSITNEKIKNKVLPRFSKNIPNHVKDLLKAKFNPFKLQSLS